MFLVVDQPVINGVVLRGGNENGTGDWPTTAWQRWRIGGTIGIHPASAAFLPHRVVNKSGTRMIRSDGPVASQSRSRKIGRPS